MICKINILLICTGHILYSNKLWLYLEIMGIDVGILGINCNECTYYNIIKWFYWYGSNWDSLISWESNWFFPCVLWFLKNMPFFGGK